MDDERQPLLRPAPASPAGRDSGPSRPNSVAGSRTGGRARLRAPISSAAGSSWRRKVACGCVLLAETFERIAFYGIVGNLVMFLNESPFNWTFYNATNALFVFTGLSYMTSILGGWIADAWFGKFKTIVAFFVIYVAGYLIFPLLTPYPDVTQTYPDDPPQWCSQKAVNKSSNWTNYVTMNSASIDKDVNWYTVIQPSSESCSWAVYLALAVIGIGNGAVKANISPFGADQIKDDGPAATRMFFNWFYWCINIGALISLGGLAYVQQEISFFWGYVAPNICLVIATIIFICGGCVYVLKPAGGSILTNIIKIVAQACRRGCCNRDRREQEHVVISAIETSAESSTSCLDAAKVRYGGSYHDNIVEDIKTLGKIFCVFIAITPYWIVYFQMETTFVVQGLHMRLDFSGNGTRSAAEARQFKIPAAWLSLFDVMFLILLIPLLDLVVYPFLDARRIMPSVRARIVIGMVFAVLAVLAAGTVEHYRLERYWPNGTEATHWQLIGTTFYRASDMTILYQIPQYALIGISEAFASVAGLELAYIQAPRSMQGIIMGLFWFTQGLGAVLGSLIIFFFRGVWFFNWDHGDINCRYVPCGTPDDPSRLCTCHLDYYFFFLAGLLVVGAACFVAIAWGLDMGVVSVNRVRRRKGKDEDEGGVPGGGRRGNAPPNGQDRNQNSRRNIQRHGSTSVTDMETDAQDTDASEYR